MSTPEAKKRAAEKRRAKMKAQVRANPNKLKAMGGFTLAQHLRFKDKWKEYDGTRLEKSEKPPVFLTHFSA